MQRLKVEDSMAYADEADISAIIDQLRELATARWPEAEASAVVEFLAGYYRGVAPSDLAQRQVSDLYGAAVSHWQLLRQPQGDWPRIEAYNPTLEQHGWESTRSVVQIAAHDMPFLVDSAMMALSRLGYNVHLVVHPVLRIADRSDRPRVLEYDAADGELFTCIHFEIDRVADDTALQAIERELREVLREVGQAVEDWQPMLRELENAVADLKDAPASEAGDLDEVAAFLKWLANDHFTFLGYRRYDYQLRDGEPTLKPQSGSGLGVLRGDSADASESFAHLPHELRLQAQQPHPLILSKVSHRSRVHRDRYLDYVGVKRFNESGEVIGEHRFLGLFTAPVYHGSPRDIPVLRSKIERIMARAQLPLQSHAGKALANVLDTLPRDELIQADEETLYQTAIGILHLQERRRVRAFVRYDQYQRFVSCLVFVPRERYNTEARRRITQILEQTFGGEHSEADAYLSESVLARIHFIVWLPQRGRPAYEPAELEAQLVQSLRLWQDDYRQALLEQLGETQGARLFRRFGDAFNAAYREDVPPRSAVHDTERIAALEEDGALGLSLYRPLEAAPDSLRFKVYHRGRAIILSDVLPMLENMGVQVVDERPYLVEQADADYWIHDFGLRRPGASELDPEQVRDTFQETFSAVWYGQVEDDGFNRLALSAGLNWRDIVVLRAYCKYLRQAGTTLSQRYIEETLDSYPQITRQLVELFHARFNPSQQNAEREAQLAAAIETALGDVPSLDEDRILRRYLAAIQATVRCNHFRMDADGNPREWLTLKLQPRTIPEMPKPVPAYELFVYSPRFEGVHLRAGKVARGGLRWSDRREDFRTEVLGLQKAQTVKNALIVPVGAKGGFVLKRPPADRDALQQEARDCYADFMRGLLDVTDNQHRGEIIPPPQVVRHDEDDPYLVVAADKGTATFSDLANSISAEYDFWLGDAFASGGSTGYDHKKMAITARGAWESVKLHFRELGIDVQNEPFTAVGVGDMSGDVFGNGMLRSRCTRLIAAFDHRHIFIDPDPDPEASYRERERLFALPRSSWDDYDRKVLSAGGGIYPRTSKTIELSDAARAALGIEATQLSPTELIRAILSAPVDLLWNGGIGTYVKASDETHAEVGDKGSDSVRINGSDLRCRVVGEGGNLGMTQRGRIEFALRGGRLNTDAIDNAGGVNSSDQEVNIKILLNGITAAGDMTEKQRNELLADMTEDLAQLVLSDNYRQAQALTLCERGGSERLDEQGRFMRALEKTGELDRALEFLPDDETLAARHAAGQGLTRPELAVLLSYAKLHGYARLVDDSVTEEKFLEQALIDYFPPALRERYREQILAHRLRREITATVVCNEIIDRMGSLFFFRVTEKMGAPVGAAARAYLATREIFGFDALWQQVEAMGANTSAEVQIDVLLALRELHEQAIYWLLRNQSVPESIDHTVQTIRPSLERLSGILPTLLPASEAEVAEQRRAALVDGGVEGEVVDALAVLELMYPMLDIVRVAGETGAALERVAEVYFTIMNEMDLHWLRQRIDRFEAVNNWQERARIGLEENLYTQLRTLTGEVLSSGGPVDAQMRHWMERHESLHQRLVQTVTELKSVNQPDLAMLTVAVQDLTALAQASAQRPLSARRRAEHEASNA